MRQSPVPFLVLASLPLLDYLVAASPPLYILLRPDSLFSRAEFCLTYPRSNMLQWSDRIEMRVKENLT